MSHAEFVQAREVNNNINLHLHLNIDIELVFVSTLNGSHRLLLIMGVDAYSVLFG